MGRPIWNGALSFGLVTVPVRLYAATEDHGVRFRQLERGTSDRVRNLRVNERTGKEVAYGDIVKGYEVGEGEYVVVEPAELEQISPGRSKAIVISGFVNLSAVDPVFFDTTYYLGPRGGEFAHAYALLQRALADSDRAGLALFAMRGKQYLAAVRAKDDLLVLQTMHYADEIRDPHREVDDLPERDQPNQRELAAAGQLIDALSIDWDPDEYRDTYVEQVKALIEAKHEGREVVAAEAPPSSTNVVDLMDVLERSLQQVKEPEAAKPAEQAAKPAKSAKSAKPTAAELAELSKAELYRLATERDVPGRSSMNREQLIEALTKPKRRLKAVS